MLIRKRIFQQKLIELPYLLAAKGKNVNERHELFDVEGVCFG